MEIIYDLHSSKIACFHVNHVHWIRYISILVHMLRYIYWKFCIENRTTWKCCIENRTVCQNSHVYSFTHWRLGDVAVIFKVFVLNSILDWIHDDVIKWKYFPRYWPFVREIHRSPVNFPHKGQWRGALMFALICVWINGWVNNREAGDLRRYRPHYDAIVMSWAPPWYCSDVHAIELHWW